MAANSLDVFVKQALDKGAPRAEVEAALLSAGWSPREIANALDAWTPTALGLAAPRPRPYVSAREAFLYLVLFILLGVTAWNLGSLLFALIDTAVADPLDDRYGRVSRDTQIRAAIAGLVVAAPLFAWLALHIRKQRRNNPAMQRSAVRKWLTYATLIIASCTLIGDAIALIYGFLSGDLSARLLLKLAVVALLAGGVFAYFIRDAEKGDEHDQQA